MADQAEPNRFPPFSVGERLSADRMNALLSLAAGQKGIFYPSAGSRIFELAEDIDKQKHFAPAYQLIWNTETKKWDAKLEVGGEKYKFDLYDPTEKWFGKKGDKGTCVFLKQAGVWVPSSLAGGGDLYRFELTGSLSQGGTAPAVIMIADGPGGYKADKAITVSDGFLGMFSGVAGQRGYAWLFADNGKYEIVQFPCPPDPDIL